MQCPIFSKYSPYFRIKAYACIRGFSTDMGLLTFAFLRAVTGYAVMSPELFSS